MKLNLTVVSIPKDEKSRWLILVDFLLMECMLSFENFRVKVLSSSALYLSTEKHKKLKSLLLPSMLLKSISNIFEKHYISYQFTYVFPSFRFIDKSGYIRHDVDSFKYIFFITVILFGALKNFYS